LSLNNERKGIRVFKFPALIASYAEANISCNLGVILFIALAFNVFLKIELNIYKGVSYMLVQAQKYMRNKNVIPTDRYLKKDSFGTSRTQERRRPDRRDALSVQKPKQS
jgi:hypothetical protein